MHSDVDTVLSASSDVHSVLMGLNDARLVALDERLELAMGDIASAAQGLMIAREDAASASLLSRRAAQLQPVLRAIKRAAAAAELDADTQQRLRLAVATLQVAARSLDAAVGEVTHTALDAEQHAQVEAVVAAAKSSADLAFSGAFGPLYFLDHGHIDAIDAAYEDDELGIMIHDESDDQDVERDPARTILVVKSAAKVSVPDERFAFLGSVGADVWVLPQNEIDAEAANILWPGIATEEIEPGVFLNDQVRVRIRNVFGPNGFSLFLSPDDETSAPQVLADSEDTGRDVITLPTSTHTHANWAFEAPGVYFVRVDVRGRLASVPGTPWVNSPVATLKFVVLP